MDLINEIATGFDWYSDATAALISVAISDSLILRFHAGWQPFAHLGFYVDLGYTLATLGGGTSAEEFLLEATGESPPDTSRASSGNEYDIASTLHMLDVELGWEWLLFDQLTLRTALAYTGTMGSSTTVEALFDSDRPVVQDAIGAFEATSAAYLDDVYSSYVHSAVVTIAVGWQLF